MQAIIRRSCSRSSIKARVAAVGLSLQLRSSSRCICATLFLSVTSFRRNIWWIAVGPRQTAVVMVVGRQLRWVKWISCKISKLNIFRFQTTLYPTESLSDHLTAIREYKAAVR